MSKINLSLQRKQNKEQGHGFAHRYHRKKVKVVKNKEARVRALLVKQKLEEIRLQELEEEIYENTFGQV